VKARATELVSAQGRLETSHLVAKCRGSSRVCLIEAASARTSDVQRHRASSTRGKTEEFADKVQEGSIGASERKHQNRSAECAIDQART